MHTALARKYRPRRFAELVAQDHVAQALRGAIVRNRVAHGYLFAGPRGVGKTTAARVLAMALNCASRSDDGEPCGSCDSCQRTWSGMANLDVVEIDAASNRGVDDARDLRERAMYAASSADRSKVYIVDEAHMLTREAWNALLKILEEPPPRVVFVFATTEPQKIAQAAAPVLSRLQRFDFRRMSAEAVATRLAEVSDAEGIEPEQDALRLIAANADGGMRDALSTLDQILAFGEDRVSVDSVRHALGLVPEDLYRELLQLIVDKRPAGVFELVDRVVSSGGDLLEFVGGAGETFRTILTVQYGVDAADVTDALRGVAKDFSGALAPEDVLQLLDLLLESEERIRHGPTRLGIETLLLKWTMLDRIVVLADALGRVGKEGSAPPRSREPSPAPAGRERRPGPRPEPEAPAQPPAEAPRAVERGAFTFERIRDLWPQVVSRIAAASPFLSQALAGAEVTEVAAPRVALMLDPSGVVHVDGIQRQRQLVEQYLGEYVEGPVRLEVRTGVGSGDTTPSSRPERITEESAKAERFKVLRAKDPALDQAADVFDLELLD